MSLGSLSLSLSLSLSHKIKKKNLFFSTQDSCALEGEKEIKRELELLKKILFIFIFRNYTLVLFYNSNKRTVKQHYSGCVV
jgi:hypothetical protein